MGIADSRADSSSRWHTIASFRWQQASTEEARAAEAALLQRAECAAPCASCKRTKHALQMLTHVLNLLCSAGLLA